MSSENDTGGGAQIFFQGLSMIPRGSSTKLNAAKSSNHTPPQTAREEKDSPGSAPHMMLGKIIQVQKSWLWE